MKKILVLEDEKAIREFTVINLKRAGYEVLEAETGEEAIEIFEKENIDVAVLDVMLPGISGFDVCKYIREHSDNIGIIMLTAKTQENDKITGLMTGADDYVTKPFSPSELIARVDALYRRVSISNNKKQKDVIISGPFKIDLSQRTVSKNDNVLVLTQVEYEVMKYFLTNIKTALSREDILKEVWGEDYTGDLKIVDVNIRRLRMKIEDSPSSPKYILAIWGFGYKWGASGNEN